MVTAKIIRVEISYPVLSAFVNFSDDGGVLAQPQVQQIAFSGDELTGFSKDNLYAKIQEYIDNYEKMLANVSLVNAEVNNSVDSTGTVMKEGI